MEGFIHFFWKKQYDGNILWTFVVEISYGDLLWGSCSDMTWDILGFGYLKMEMGYDGDTIGNITNKLLMRVFSRYGGIPEHSNFNGETHCFPPLDFGPFSWTNPLWADFGGRIHWGDHRTYFRCSHCCSGNFEMYT